MTPVRVQLKRAKGWRMPPDTVKVDRSTQWGNPWPVGGWGPLQRQAPDAQGAVGLFSQMLTDTEMRAAAGYPADLSPLRGKNLACWCALDAPCHADALLRLANVSAHLHPSTNAPTVESPGGGQETTMRIYLSGPMSGLPDLNFPAFHAATAALRDRGYTVVNPAELNPDNTTAWDACMRADIKALCDCTTLALLPGWERSQGAHLEMHIAHRIGIDVLQLDALLNGSVASTL